MAKTFDAVVIGGGPGGYIAAIRAAQLGMQVACVDDWKTPAEKPALGGTCTNVGCIPSKALLQSSENYEHAGHGFAEHGVQIKGLAVDVGQMLKRKDKIVKQNNEGILYLFKKNKVAFYHGHGSFVRGDANGWEIKVAGSIEETLTARHAIVATGSSPRALPGTTFDNKLILDNEGALAIPEVPKRLGVVGAGVIGLELGSVWRRLGSKVHILEALPGFLGAADDAIAQEAWKIFTREGELEIELGVNVASIAQGKAGVSVDYKTAEGKAAALACDRLIVSIGRVPNTEGLGADRIGLKIDATGFIEVDKNCRASLPRIYAVGDVVRGPMLAHKGEDEGVMVAEIIAGQHGHVNYDAIPWVMYTMPEIAWVGKTEQQLKAEGIAYRSGRFPFAYNGRALGRDEAEGFIKILADAATDRILGVHAIGSLASELIAEAVVAIEFGASSEDIARICHAHPSLSEVMREAALAVDKRSLNG